MDKKKSIDDILDALNAGEIVRGDKGFETIKTGTADVQFNSKTGEIYFTLNGVTTSSRILNNGTIQNLELTESDTGKPLFDTELTRNRLEFIKNLHLRPNHES